MKEGLTGHAGEAGGLQEEGKEESGNRGKGAARR